MCMYVYIYIYTLFIYIYIYISYTYTYLSLYMCVYTIYIYICVQARIFCTRTKAELVSFGHVDHVALCYNVTHIHPVRNPSSQSR